MTDMTIAPLQNVSLCTKALDRSISRPQHLPSMVVFYGPSGYGKSMAACYATNKLNAVYIECKSTWTRKAILSAIARELGVVPATTMYELTDQISSALVLSERPLIIDEVDYVVDRHAVEIIRDIHEGAQVPILLIGEEKLPVKLKKWERFHGRILDFVQAQPASFDDAAILARFYCKRVAVSEDLLAAVTEVARGSARRICVNLALIEEEALTRGKKDVDLGTWRSWKRHFFTGEAPVRAVFS